MNKKMIENLKKKLKSLAIADAIIEPEWEYRYFSYNSQWGQNEEMASMRDGSGGHWFVLFEPDNVAYKCISPDDGFIDNFEEIEACLAEGKTFDRIALTLNEGGLDIAVATLRRYIFDLRKRSEGEI